MAVFFFSPTACDCDTLNNHCVQQTRWSESDECVQRQHNDDDDPGVIDMLASVVSHSTRRYLRTFGRSLRKILPGFGSLKESECIDSHGQSINRI